MHSRHRSSGNGYRPMGMRGISAPSRIAPESSIRGGNGMFKPEYRNYGHGIGRSHPRPPPTQVAPPTPQHRPDIFAEAGRLATEYLVSRGVLPQDVLTGKWQNGSLKNLMGDFRGFRQQEGDSLPHYRSRNGSDLGSGRRRQSDEYSKPDGSKVHSRDKSRSKSNGLDLGQEMGRSSSLSEKARSNLDLGEREIDSEAANVGQPRSQSRDVKPASDVTGESQSVVDHIHNRDDMAHDGKDLQAEIAVELPKVADDVKLLDQNTADPKDGNRCQVEKQNGEKNSPTHDCAAEDEPVDHSSNNLSNPLNFSKVPSKTHSMMVSKDDLVPTAEEEKEVVVSQGSNCDNGPLAGSEVVFKDASINDSSVIETPNQAQGSKCADLDNVKQTPDAGESDQMDTDQGTVRKSQSLPLSSFMDEHKHEGYLGIGRCSSMNNERGEKRTTEYIDDEVVIKKPREWDMTGVTQVHEYLHPSQSTLIQDQLALEKVGPATSCESVLHKNGVEAIDYAEEMQLFPGSFKICDLNTVEASQGNEISVPEPTLLLPSITESKNDVDLSTNSNRGLSSTYTRCGADGKEIEVIDLDDDHLQVDNVFDSSERKVFMGSESFPDHAQIVNDISGVQDSYELMMCDFLGNDIAGSGNVNSLQNDVALDNGEGILGDDESIYMSLGEIPISFLGVWQQSPQHFDNKPF